MSKSKKGSAFERRICSQLSLWWSEGKSDSLFWRTANSGGRATTRAKKSKDTKNAHSDIAATDPSSQPLMDLLVLELKRGYNRYTIQDLIDKPKGAAEQIHEEWFRKVIHSSKLAGTPHWMVIVQRDRREALAFFPWRLAEEVHISYEIPLKLQVKLQDVMMAIACIPLVELLRKVKPEQVRRLAERWQHEMDRNPRANDSRHNRDSLCSPPGQRPQRKSGKGKNHER